MQVSCQARTHEGCASFHLPPNSLELFTLFSLPFLHFYNFSGTRVEWVGGRSPVLPGPTGQFARRGALWPLGSFFTFFSSSSQD